MSEFSETLARVRYKDTDQMGMVYYGNYFTFFEIGRVEYMRERGIAYKLMEREDDSFIVVAEATCRYLKPARYDDLLRIRTRVSESRRRSIRFAYEIWRDEDGEMLATGETLHIICNRHGRPKSLPEKYRRLFPLDSGKLDSRKRGSPETGISGEKPVDDHPTYRDLSVFGWAMAWKCVADKRTTTRNPAATR